MPNMSLEKNKMPSQEPSVRAHNFDEVALGYTEEPGNRRGEALPELQEYALCIGLSVKIHIPEFIAKVAEGDFEGAYEVICRASSLPAVCGRVCPQESQCESKCVRGIKARAWASAGLSALSPIGT